MCRGTCEDVRIDEGVTSSAPVPSLVLALAVPVTLAQAAVPQPPHLKPPLELGLAFPAGLEERVVGKVGRRWRVQVVPRNQRRVVCIVIVRPTPCVIVVLRTALDVRQLLGGLGNPCTHTGKERVRDGIGIAWVGLAVTCK
eukprot:7257174-Prymnesium_polylepis.1